MSRLPRLSIAGLPHLVLLQGLAGQPVVHDDEDGRACLAAMREAAILHQVAIHAYSLHAERLRLLATPDSATGLGRCIQDFGRRYVGSFNRRHGRRGTLWEGRFRACVVQPGRLAMLAQLFVESDARWSDRATLDAETAAAAAAAAAAASDEALLQDRRPIAGRPCWTSAPHHLGHRRDALVTTDAGYWQLGNTPFEREQAYAARLSDGLSAAERVRVDEACRHGWALGDEGFLADLQSRLTRPVRPRPRGRPPRQPA